MKDINDRAFYELKEWHDRMVEYLLAIEISTDHVNEIIDQFVNATISAVFEYITLHHKQNTIDQLDRLFVPYTYESLRPPMLLVPLHSEMCNTWQNEFVRFCWISKRTESSLEDKTSRIKDNAVGSKIM